jgi:hypothetical protein
MIGPEEIVGGDQALEQLGGVGLAERRTGARQ